MRSKYFRIFRLLAIGAVLTAMAAATPRALYQVLGEVPWPLPHDPLAWAATAALLLAAVAIALAPAPRWRRS